MNNKSRKRAYRIRRVKSIADSNNILHLRRIKKESPFVTCHNRKSYIITRKNIAIFKGICPDYVLKDGLERSCSINDGTGPGIVIKLKKKK